jgi:hypothetical protein
LAVCRHQLESWSTSVYAAQVDNLLAIDEILLRYANLQTKQETFSHPQETTKSTQANGGMRRLHYIA